MSTTIESRVAWVRTCGVDDLEPGWGEVALHGSRQIALVLLDDREVYAVDHHDPHTGAPVMARGIVGSRGERPTIASPLHKEVYDLGTGECFTDGSLALRTYRTRIVGGMIEVELDV
ncbi:nitrite reductase small subunit NirD [Agromyces sp. H3Y2-19a]|uniref:nitrite reductase small subunit NirD n=1 Tax=Agromyces TaxID=33877 RepID=UPI001E2FB18B|nr:MULTISPECIES: nitrite reductase small subunit NirD [Agromyces]MCD5346889.1 nitrite reductase small subunit NirD [Agromyces sp. S2-1-8]MDF0515079.1 nitrite reductase small subunit NirD [Agromyces chromiiresistens]